MRRPSVSSSRLEARAHSQLPPDREMGDVRRRLRIAMLVLALLPMTVGLLVGFSLMPEADHARPAQQAARTWDAAAAVVARQHSLEVRIAAAAADPGLVRVLERTSGSTPPSTASRVLGVLGPEGPEAVAICPVPSTGGPPVAISGSDISALVDVCSRRSAQGATPVLSPGEVRREVVRGKAGSLRLVVLTAIRTADGGTVGLLAAEVRLADLVSSALEAVSGVSSIHLVDAISHEVLGGAAPDTEPSQVAPLDLDVRVGGILSGHAGTARSLLASGWSATSAPLVLAGDDSRLALISIWPTAQAPVPIVLLAALGALFVAALAAAIAMARRFGQPFLDLARSQAHLEVLYAEAREDSLHDGLTGLGNHRAFQEELDRQMEIHRRHGVPISLLLIDMDDLKTVNDSEGHAAGDELLQGMANAIRDSLRYGDRAFRIGGDEFVVILPHTDAAEARVPASRLLHLCLSPAAGERRLAFSGGISSVPQQARDRDELYRQADAALYWCKRHGRASVEIYDPGRDQVEEADEKDAAGAAVHDTVRRRLLTPVYQPIIDLRSGAVLGFEGLVRLLPGASFGNPGELFAAAAASGRIVELDLACVEVVAQGARAIDSSRIVSINLSPRTLEAHDFTPRWLLEQLSRYGIDPGRVIVEVTEREPVTDIETLIRNVGALQHSGVRVAADDVGAGNAGLRLLSQVRFDVVKIDLTLVQEGTQRESSQAVLRSLYDLAGRQGAAVVAEGVETPEQLRALRELGVPAAQGYLLGRPSATLSIEALDLDALEAGTLFLGGAGRVPAAGMSAPVAVEVASGQAAAGA